VVINEVLYDPEGSDTDREFVELAAALGCPADASLAGWVVETGNGARPGEWTVAWVGGASDRLRDGRFLVAEPGVPGADVTVSLDLQNGPDACRVRGPGGEEDRVGWGTPLDEEFFEGAPASDVTGLSLARQPDGRDTEENAEDFRAAEPSPGEFNVPAVAVAVDSFAVENSLFHWTARNVGRIASALSVRAVCRVHPDEELAVARTRVLDPGEQDTLVVVAGPPPGIHWPVSDPMAPSAVEPWGHGPELVISEALTRPSAGPEWIELRSVGLRDAELAAFGLEDASGGRLALDGAVSAGGFVLVTEDSAALRNTWSVPAGVPVVESRTWPALNHTGPREEAAERLVLTLGGRVMERVSLTWERRCRELSGDDITAWSPSASPKRGTPGRENSLGGDRAVALGASRVTVDPAPFRPRRDGAALVVVRGVIARDCRITVHDSVGREVARLLAWRVPVGDSGEEEHRAVWDGRDTDGMRALPGLYVVRVEPVPEGAARAAITVAP
jgi:hypothetical protein